VHANTAEVRPPTLSLFLFFLLLLLPNATQTWQDAQPRVPTCRCPRAPHEPGWSNNKQGTCRPLSATHLVKGISQPSPQCSHASNSSYPRLQVSLKASHSHRGHMGCAFASRGTSPSVSFSYFLLTHSMRQVRVAEWNVSERSQDSPIEHDILEGWELPCKVFKPSATPMFSPA